MFYDREEARKQWCPFASVAHGEGSSPNRFATGESMPGSECLSEQCMMWVTLGDGSADGYCGLVRIPEKAIEAFTR